MRTRHLHWIPIAAFVLALVLLAALLATCGGKKSRKTTLPTIGSATKERPAPGVAVEQSLDDALAELDAFQAPEGIDPGLFDTLKGALRDALIARNTGKFVSAPPGDTSRVTDLDLVDIAGTYALTWHYRNEGDYDQSGTVNIADITPIAMYYGQEVSPDGENTLVGVVDGSGNGVIDIADITPIAMGYMTEVAYYITEGAQSLLDHWQWVAQTPFEDAVGVGRKRFEVPLYSLDYQTYHITPYNSANEAGVTSVDTLSSHSIEVSGTVEWDTGGPVEGAWVTATTSDGSSVGESATDASGAFTIELAPVAFNIKVSVEAEYDEPTTGLTITNFDTTERILSEGAVDSVLVVLPDPTGSELVMDGNQATSADGGIVISNLDADITQVYAKSYDPDENPEAFPGEFADDGGFELNSSVFMWVTAKDAAGEQVTYPDSPAEIVLEIPPAQWGDIDDIYPNNDQIDVPIYDFNYETGEWGAEEDGFLVDETGAPIPEEEEENIIAGTYAGRIFAAFSADHFSYKNVDYPYIYVWTLDRISRTRRNNSCFYDALRLAERIAQSQKGKDAFAKVNKSGKTIEGEYLKDGKPDPEKKAPEINTREMEWNSPTASGGSTTTLGEYWGRVRDWKDDEFYLNEHIWDLATPTSSEADKRAATFLMANTILHEFAHQKQHVKKGEAEMIDSNNDGTLDTPMEMGERLSIDIFGGHFGYLSAAGGVVTVKDTDGDGRPDSGLQTVDDATIKDWLDHDNWPKAGSSVYSASQAGDSGLEIAISTAKQDYDDNEPVVVDITLTNGGSAPIEVLPEMFAVSYPLAFVIESETEEFAVWQGPMPYMTFSEDAYQTLEPGEDVEMSYDLRYDENGKAWRYDLFTWGTYTISVFYSQFVPPYDPVESNEITITVKNAPVAEITADPYVGDPPLDVALDASTSYDPDGSIVSYEWDYEGDGIYDLNSGTTPNAQHIYDIESVYRPTVRITDDDGYASTAFTYIGVGISPQWMMFRGDLTHKARSPVAGPRTPSLRWTSDVAPVNECSPAIDLDGTIYIGGNDGYLYAVYPNGARKWATELGGAIKSSPAIAFDGTIYVGSEDSNLYAVEPDGTLKWSYPTTGAINSSPAVGWDGTVYVGSRGGWFYAINPDGSLKWEYEDTGPYVHKVASSPAIAIDGTIYVGSDSYVLYAFNPDGSLAWDYTGEEMIYSSPALGDDGTIYYGTWAGQSQSGLGRVYAHNPGGSLKWMFDEIGPYDVDASPAIGWDGTIYVGSNEGIFYAINPDGSPKWTFEANGAIYSSAAVGADGSIYFGDDNRYLYALNPDGSLLWSYETGGSLHRTGPVIGQDGSLYVGTGDGKLYKFRDN